MKEIFSLAAQKQWVQAKAMAADLLKDFPDDETAQRIANWTAREEQVQRSKAVEDTIRDIEDKQDTTFNPTIKSILTDGSGRAQPLRKDVRDAVQKIEAAP